MLVLGMGQPGWNGDKKKSKKHTWPPSLGTSGQLCLCASWERRKSKSWFGGVGRVGWDWWGGMGGVGGVELVRKAWRDYIGLGIGLANLCLHQALKPCL